MSDINTAVVTAKTAYVEIESQQADNPIAAVITQVLKAKDWEVLSELHDGEQEPALAIVNTASLLERVIRETQHTRVLLIHDPRARAVARAAEEISERVKAYPYFAADGEEEFMPKLLDILDAEQAEQ